MDETSELIVMIFGCLFSFRFFKYSMINSGKEINDGLAIALTLAGLIGLFSLGENVGHMILLFGLIVVTILTTIFMTYYAGVAVGVRLKSNIIGAILMVILVIAPFLTFILEPLVSSTLYSAIMFVVLYYDYKDRYSYVSSEFWNNPTLKYVWVWPPMVLIASIFDLIVIENYLPPPSIAMISLFIVFCGAAAGYKKAY